MWIVWIEKRPRYEITREMVKSMLMSRKMGRYKRTQVQENMLKEGLQNP